jgi:hypothetical protein
VRVIRLLEGAHRLAGMVRKGEEGVKVTGGTAF